MYKNIFLKKFLCIVMIIAFLPIIHYNVAFAEPISLADAPDDAGNVTIVEVNTEYSGSIKSGDYDWYKFTTTEHMYNIVMTCDSDYAGYILYDSDFVKVKNGSFWPNGTATNVLSLTKNKTYYLKIQQSYSHCPNYTFTIHEYQYPDKVAYYQYIKNNSEHSSFYGFNIQNPDEYKSITPNITFNEHEVICIPIDSYITFELNNPIINSKNISEIVIKSFPEEDNNGGISVYASSDTENWIKLGDMYNNHKISSFDIKEHSNIKYIRLVGNYKTFNLISINICTGHSNTDKNSNPVIETIPESNVLCEAYSADVFPKSGLSNYTDNDKTGTPFQFIVDTSTNIEDIYVMTETGWKITSDNFEYVAKNEDNGKLLWTFSLYINSPGNRTFTIYGTDSSGNVSNGVNVDFEVTGQNVEKLATPVIYFDNKKAEESIKAHKSDNLILKWDAVPDADKYAVYIWGVNNNNPVYEGYSPTYQIDKNMVDYAQYAVSVYATSASVGYSQSDPATFNLTLNPKLVVTSNAESFNKNKTLVAPANCVPVGSTQQECSDVYVDCDTNYTIKWVDAKTGKGDKTWCDYNNDNKYLIKSWIKQNNSGVERKIKVTLTAENLSFTYYIIQEGTSVQTNAVNSVDYASEIRANGWDEKRISALDTAKNAVYFEWVAPYTFSTHKSKTGTFNKAYSVDGYIYNSTGEQHTTQSSKNAVNKSWVFYQGKTYRGIPYTMTNRLYTPEKWGEKLLTAQNGSELSKTGLDCTSFGSYVTFGNPSGVTTSYFYDKSISISITKDNGTSATFYGMKNNITDDGGNIKWKRYNNIPNSDAEWENYATHPADIYNVLKPGDAVVYRNSNGGHMMIFVGKEKERYYFYEATPAITQYTNYSAKSLWGMGYQPFYATIYND